MPVLVCESCGLEKPVPTHCGGPMKLSSGRLSCEACGFETEILKHCGKTMMAR